MYVKIGACILLAFLAACASANPRTSSGARPQRDVITEAEIANASGRNAYELIKSLRPGMLVQRGPTSLHDPDKGIAVFVDNQKFSDDVSALRNLSTADIHEIRFVSAAQAQLRWGMGYPSGVILVTMKRR
jgi:hypothetical protein